MVQTSASRQPFDLSHLGFLSGMIGCLKTVSFTPVLPGDSFSMDAIGSFRLAPLRRGLAIDALLELYTFYIPHRFAYGDDFWKKFIMAGEGSKIFLPTVETTQYIDHTAYLGTVNPSSRRIPKFLHDGYLRIWNNYFKRPDRNEYYPEHPTQLSENERRYGMACCHLKTLWSAPLPKNWPKSYNYSFQSGSINLVNLQANLGILDHKQERSLFMQRYRDVIKDFGGKVSYEVDKRPLLLMRSKFWSSGYDVNGTDQVSLGQFSGRVQQNFRHVVPRFHVPEHGCIFTLALVRFPPLCTEEHSYIVGLNHLDYEFIAGDPKIAGNFPSKTIYGDGIFRNGSKTQHFETPYAQWYRYQPSYIDPKYHLLSGFPFIQGRPYDRGTIEELCTVQFKQYNPCFQNLQLNQWNAQAKFNVQVYRRMPSSLQSLKAV